MAPGEATTDTDDATARAARGRATARAIVASVHDIATDAADQLLTARPDLADHPTPTGGRGDWVDAGILHLEHLAAAVATGHPAVLAQHLAWSGGLVTARGGDASTVSRHLDLLLGAAPVTGERALASVQALADEARSAVGAVVPTPVTYLDPSGPLGELASAFLDALLAGDRHGASRSVLRAADEGVPVEELYLEVFQPVLREVGRRWETGEVTVGQEHLVTAATQLVMAQLYPRTFATPRIGRTVVVASVGGELHEVGGRMVADLFELRGWDTRFVGANAPTSSLVWLAREVGADVVAVSVTLSRHLPEALEAVASVQELRGPKVLVGGRPFNRVPELWRAVGADATAEDARGAVAVAAQLAGEA